MLSDLDACDGGRVVHSLAGVCLVTSMRVIKIKGLAPGGASPPKLAQGAVSNGMDTDGYGVSQCSFASEGGRVDLEPPP